MKQIEVVAAVIRKGDKVFATQRGYGEFKATRTAPLPDMNKHIQGALTMNFLYVNISDMRKR